MSYNSVESVFNEAVIEDIEEEACEAAEYGDMIDSLAGLSDVDISLRYVGEGVSDSMLNAILGDDDVMRSELMDLVDDEIAQDDLEEEEDETNG